jgi:translation elongation factor EF-1beta
MEVKRSIKKVLESQGDVHEEGGEPIQFGIAEFESNSESRTTSYSN